MTQCRTSTGSIPAELAQEVGAQDSGNQNVNKGKKWKENMMQALAD